MNKYEELIKRHQKELSAVPVEFAFDLKQFNEIMKNWGLDSKKDLDKIFSVGYGGYMLKKDVEVLNQTRKRQDKEFNNAITSDKTGNGFIYEMFYYELRNREYGYTFEADDTLEALGYTYDDLQKNQCLMHGFEKAKNKIIEEENKKK